MKDSAGFQLENRNNLGIDQSFYKPNSQTFGERGNLKHRHFTVGDFQEPKCFSPTFLKCN